MFASQTEIAVLLNRWIAEKSQVTVVYSKEGEATPSTHYKGKVTEVMMTTFSVASESGETFEYHYDHPQATISEDARTLRLVYPSHEVLVLHEV
jgi:hypothetical protein